jgi:hypothetical protein
MVFAKDGGIFAVTCRDEFSASQSEEEPSEHLTEDRKINLQPDTGSVAVTITCSLTDPNEIIDFFEHKKAQGYHRDFRFSIDRHRLLVKLLE